MGLSLIGEAEVVQKRGIRRLFLVSIHLVIDRDAPPATGGGARRIPLVNRTGHAVQRYRLEKQ